VAQGFPRSPERRKDQKFNNTLLFSLLAGNGPSETGFAGLHPPPPSPNKPGCQSPQARRPPLRPLSLVPANGISVSAATGRLHGSFALSVSGVRNPVPHGTLGRPKASAREALKAIEYGGLLIRIEAEILELRSPERIRISQALNIDAAR
jgi:hypothetical protein